MKRSRFIEQQIAFALQQAEQGTQVAEITRKMGISDQIFYRWKKKFGELMPSEVQKFRQLEGLFQRHGAPQVLRRDQGPEFEAKVFQRLLRTWRVKDEPVPKAQPYDNGYMESFHGSLREELLDAELFYSLEEAQAKVGNWLT